MEKRDWLLWQIEQMQRVLVRIRELILGGNPAAAMAQLQHAAAEVGLDLGMARALPEDTLLDLLSSRGTPDPGRCFLMGELLYLNGLRAREQGEADEASRSFEKALRLLLTAYPGLPSASAQSARARIDELIPLVEQRAISATLRQGLDAYRAVPRG